MTINKELCNKLQLINSDLLINDREILCYLEKQNKEKWTFHTSTDLDLDKDQKSIIVKMNYVNYITQFTGTILEAGNDYIVICKPTDSQDPYLKDTIEALDLIEKNDEKYGQRKERRIKIGIKKSKDFGLKSPEQVFVLERERYSGPCAIVDASIHGVQILVPYSSILRNINNFNMLISFENPNQHIILDLHKVNIKLTKNNDKTYANISCQIMEPISYIWKERLIKLLNE